jgi:hypothetical protein
VPLRRPWDPPGEWADLVTQDEYLNAFFYHGSEGQLAAVRCGRWKLMLSPAMQLYDLETDPGESKPVRDPAIQRKLRGMAVLFQEEMSRSARPPVSHRTTCVIRMTIDSCAQPVILSTAKDLACEHEKPQMSGDERG